MRNELTLLDWKRRVFGLYAEVRASRDPEAAWVRWCAVREELYRSHSQSPRLGAAPAYFPYDERYRAIARIEAVASATLDVAGSAESVTRFSLFATAQFELLGEQLELELYWLEAYGGGIFVPFGDTTNGDETYGAGRYVLDTVKGADLGGDDGTLMLDFNFAFNPSCAYDAAWACPFAPPANRLRLRIEAGELAPA